MNMHVRSLYLISRGHGGEGIRLLRHNHRLYTPTNVCERSHGVAWGARTHRKAGGRGRVAAQPEGNSASARRRGKSVAQARTGKAAACITT